MSTKDKWIIFIILAAVVIAVITFVKLAPFWVSIIAMCTFIFGTIAGWTTKYLYDKYILKD